jgi:hypothetical protein
MQARGFQIIQALRAMNIVDRLWRPACTGRPYSLDIRERVVAAVHGEMSCEEAVEQLQRQKPVLHG